MAAPWGPDLTYCAVGDPGLAVYRRYGAFAKTSQADSFSSERQGGMLPSKPDVVLSAPVTLQPFGKDGIENAVHVCQRLAR
jgi:hypothetical protein